MAKHKHYEFIDAWANGKHVQWKIDAKNWCNVPEHGCNWIDVEYRIKPERVYPETRMDGTELFTAYFDQFDKPPTVGRLKNVANAAIKHAVDAGQVVIPDETIWTDFKWSDEARIARDMAIALAVRNVCERVINHGYSTVSGIDLPDVISTVK